MFLAQDAYGRFYYQCYPNFYSSSPSYYPYPPTTGYYPFSWPPYPYQWTPTWPTPSVNPVNYGYGSASNFIGLNDPSVHGTSSSFQTTSNSTGIDVPESKDHHEQMKHENTHFHVKKHQNHPNDVQLVNEDLWKSMPQIANQLYLFGSSIDNIGVKSWIDISTGSYIVEYIGERFATSLTESRQKMYTQQGITRDYIFTIDEDVSIDATDRMKSNSARYINHCCEPNTECIPIIVNDEKRIVIVANTNIKANTEITYDYKFEEAKEDEELIKCYCKALKCRQYLN